MTATTTTVQIGDVAMGGGAPLGLIAGPCAIESESHCLEVARALRGIAQRVGVPLIFKASYDKANRLSLDSYRGPGLREGLRILAMVKAEVGLPVLSDVHGVDEVAPAAAVLDVIQIPAFLSRQTDLLVAAAQTGKVVNIKKGQFLAPEDMRYSIEKVARSGNHRIIVTERGVSFGYGTLVSDFRALPIMRGFGYPVVYDATHAVQMPGGRGGSSGGRREFVPGLARAAVAMGCDGLFLEVHPDPEGAPSDGATMLRLSDLEPLLRQVLRIERVVREDRGAPQPVGRGP